MKNYEEKDWTFEAMDKRHKAKERAILRAEMYLGEFLLEFAQQDFTKGKFRSPDALEFMSSGEWTPSKDQMREAMFESLNCSGCRGDLTKIVDEWISK